MSTASLRTGLPLLMFFSIVSCGPRVLPPEPKINPSPRERYEITLTVQDPPAPYRIGDVWAQMDIPNLACVPLADEIAGYRPNTTARQPFEFERTGENTYVGYIYADYFLPEDYYGMGVCQWKITMAHADIHMSGLEQWVGLDQRELNGERPSLNYCRRPETNPISPDGCLSPSFREPSDKEKKMNYFVVMESRRT